MVGIDGQKKVCRIDRKKERKKDVEEVCEC